MLGGSVWKHSGVMEMRLAYSLVLNLHHNAVPERIDSLFYHRGIEPLALHDTRLKVSHLRCLNT